MEFNHKSVLLFETVNSLNIKPDGIYVDGTAGGAGHSAEIAKKLTSGRLFAFDRDPEAVETAKERLKGYNATVIHANFDAMDEHLKELGISKVDGIMLDLGVSSHQLDTANRGFSFHNDAPLDMRMSKEGMTAAEVVNNYSQKELIRIFREYGEEKFAVSIANGIIKSRETKPITTTLELSNIISDNVPNSYKRAGHPARKVFQAIRIEVNGELESLSKALDKAFDLLNPDGVLSIITFHSLEDRMVKQRFREYCTGCICPPDIPICVCGRKPRGELLARKPVVATEQELADNPRSRSAKLRVIKKL